MVELTGLDPVTPTLPGRGESRESALQDRFRAVVAVVRRATVVSVVVKSVVSTIASKHRFLPSRLALLSPRARAGCRGSSGLLSGCGSGAMTSPSGASSAFHAAASARRCRLLCGWLEFEHQANSREHVHEGIQAELVDLSVEQIRDARLSDMEPLRGLCLSPAVLFDALLDGKHEHAA